jgi:site-specific DNA-methyltransferase (cytosine-N4-specific)
MLQATGVLTEVLPRMSIEGTMDLIINENAEGPYNPIKISGAMLLIGDALRVLARLPTESVQCIITSPPYWGLRDYAVEGQIGLEATMPQFINRLLSVFREARRVLKPDGVFWLNIGDGYTSGNRGWRAPDKKNPARAMNVRPETPEGLKPKDLLGIPWRLAFALQEDGWYLRSDIVWNKPNAMPESVKDRPSRSHEFLFLFSKEEHYYYDVEATREPREDGDGYRNKRTVWNVHTEALKNSHFATFPRKLVEPCLLAGSRPGDTILDPFFGSGTVGVVAQELGRNYIGIELNPDYVSLAVERLSKTNGTFNFTNGKYDNPYSTAGPPDRVLAVAESASHANHADSSGRSRSRHSSRNSQ